MSRLAPASFFSREALVDKALAALGEVMDAYKEGPTRHRLSLRLALAFLDTGGDRWPFNEFWKAATSGGEGEVYALAFGRFQTMRASLEHIHRLHGRERP